MWIYTAESVHIRYRTCCEKSRLLRACTTSISWLTGSTIPPATTRAMHAVTQPSTSSTRAMIRLAMTTTREIRLSVSEKACASGTGAGTGTDGCRATETAGIRPNTRGGDHCQTRLRHGVDHVQKTREKIPVGGVDYAWGFPVQRGAGLTRFISPQQTAVRQCPKLFSAPAQHLLPHHQAFRSVVLVCVYEAHG